MNWQALAELRRELKAYVQMKVADVFLWSRTANASELGKEDAVETADDDPDRGQRPARRIEPFGFRSRPPAKQRCLSLKLGSSTVIYLGVASDGGYGPGDLEDGEVSIYNKVSGTTIVLDKDGNIKIDAGTGADVVVNGGSAKVGRVGDAVWAATSMNSWLTSVSTFCSIAPPADFGVIHEGADHFKG